MINTLEFTQRLQKVIDYFEETASSFAEKIGVQRSSISHILSGRNKPSLDFVMKILHTYPEVELYWLLNGKGKFPHQPNHQEIKKPTRFKNPPKNSKPNDSDLVSNLNSISNSKIEHIVIFYTDGSFKSYKP